MGCQISDETQWKDKSESPRYQSVAGKDTKMDSDTNNDIIAQNPLEALMKMKMTQTERERALTMKFFIDDLIPSGYHIVLYGAAGSGKTTIALHWCYKIAKAHIDTQIFYLYLDGQIGMAANFTTFLEENGVSDRIHLLTNANVSEALNLIGDIVKSGQILPEKMVVILDTLKFLNPNVNNKDANVKAMQRIKKLTALGITFISLHHTNKDGENFAGTAEIEQDGDALLKIETAPGEKEHTRISTIGEGGRVRYFMQPQTYTFMQGEPSTVQEMETVLDPEKIIQQQEDSYAISIVKGLLTAEGRLTKTKLEELLKDDDGFDLNEQHRKRILRAYEGVHWKITKGGERNHIHYYTVIDDTSSYIESINQQIGRV